VTSQVVVHLRYYLNIRLHSAFCVLRSAFCVLRSAFCVLRSAICNLQSAICEGNDISSVLCFSVTHSTFLCLLPLLYFAISGSRPHHDIILLFLSSPNSLLSFTFLLSLFRFFSSSY